MKNVLFTLLFGAAAFTATAQDAAISSDQCGGLDAAYADDAPYADILRALQDAATSGDSAAVSGIVAKAAAADAPFYADLLAAAAALMPSAMPTAMGSVMACAPAQAGASIASVIDVLNNVAGTDTIVDTLGQQYAALLGAQNMDVMPAAGPQATDGTVLNAPAIPVENPSQISTN